MKKIAIVTPKLGIGGCEKALIAMLKAMNKDKYDITIFIKENGGDLLRDVPSWIKVMVIDDANKDSAGLIKNYIKQRKFLKAINSMYYLLLLRTSKNKNKQLFYYSKALSDVNERFDLAISYFMPPNFSDWYVINHINSNKKAIWIHSDVMRIKDIHNKMHENMYLKYDKIFCVCKDVAENFKKCFKSTTEKVDIFYNIISKGSIVEKANNLKSFDDIFNGIRILTVGRLSKEKGQLLIPEILVRLKNDGLNVRWYCVGNGYIKDELNEAILKYNLRNNLILLGTKDNPYPYMRDCDIYVQPSEYEGYCTTVEEARCFNKPIIMTNCTGAKEQVIDGETGFIVNYNENELYEKIKLLVDNKELRDFFEENCKNKIIDSTNEIEKIDKLFN